MVNVFKHTQPMATKTKNRLLIGAAYAPILCLWLYGYFELGMPWWDFAIVLFIFGVLKILSRKTDKSRVTIIGNIIVVGIGVLGVFIGVNSNGLAGCLFVVFLGILLGTVVELEYYPNRSTAIYPKYYVVYRIGQILLPLGIFGFILHIFVMIYNDIVRINNISDISISSIVGYVFLVVFYVFSVILAVVLFGGVPFVILSGVIRVVVGRFVLPILNMAHQNECSYNDPFGYAVCFFPYSRLWLLWLLQWLLPQGKTLQLLPIFVYTVAFLPLLVLCLIFLPIYIFFLRGSRTETKYWEDIAAYPNLLCPRHHTRTTRRRHALFYYDVVCRHASCISFLFRAGSMLKLSAPLIVGIQRVVGVIGDITQERTGETFYVSVWNEATQQGDNADLDVLEILASDRITNYDHAIDAAITVLRNDLSRPKDYLRRVPVRIQQGIYVSEQTRRSLRTYFASIEEIA